MKKQQAVMALYRQTGVNPLSGCIPVVIQMPILYAMFRFFPQAIQLRQQSFLWADDLSSWDSIYSWSAHIPYLSDWYGNHISLFTILMGITTMMYTSMNSSNMPQQEGMPNMKVMMYLFPVMMLFFFNQYASGLSFYYFLGNLVAISQMYVIKNYIISEDKIKAKIEANKTRPKKESKFQARLAEMAKQRQKK